MDYKKLLYLLLDSNSLDQVAEVLRSVGIDGEIGYENVSEWIEKAGELDSYIKKSIK